MPLEAWRTNLVNFWFSVVELGLQFTRGDHWYVGLIHYVMGFIGWEIIDVYRELMLCVLVGCLIDENLCVGFCSVPYTEKL